MDCSPSIPAPGVDWARLAETRGAIRMSDDITHTPAPSQDACHHVVIIALSQGASSTCDSYKYVLRRLRSRTGSEGLAISGSVKDLVCVHRLLTNSQLRSRCVPLVYICSLSLVLSPLQTKFEVFYPPFFDEPRVSLILGYSLQYHPLTLGNLIMVQPL